MSKMALSCSLKMFLIIFICLPRGSSSINPHPASLLDHSYFTLSDAGFNIPPAEENKMNSSEHHIGNNIKLSNLVLEEIGPASFDEIRHERKMVGLLTTLMDYRDHRSEKLVKYISTFFKHLENKIKQKGMGVTSLNALIQSLDSADMKCAFDEILKDLEIPNKCEEDLIMMLGMVHPPENPHWMGDQALNDPPPQVPPNSPSTTERSLVEMMSYISVNDELDDHMKEVLQKVVKVAIHAQTSN